MATRQEILAEATQIVSVDRNAAYGNPEDNFRTIADYWNNYIASIPNRRLQPHDVAAMMVLMKLSRVGTSPEKTDHWVDIAGYAACGGECKC